MNDEKPTGSHSLVDDRTTVASLHNLIASPKPPGIGPVDILHVVLLMLRKGEDHPILDSQQSLAEYFGVDKKTIVRSQKRLEDLDWLSRPRRKGRTSELRLNYDNIPASEPVRLKITPLAGQLAVGYQQALQKLGRKRFPKHWLKQQQPSAQRILDRCGGDTALVVDIMRHALNHPKHRNKARKSLYELLGRWAKVMQTYEAQRNKQMEEAR